MKHTKHTSLELTGAGATLRAHAGEIILLTGEAGSGKSLWLHRLAELVDMPPGLKTTLIVDQSIPRVRMLFDRWPSIWLGQTVAEELMFGLRNQPTQQHLEQALMQWGLANVPMSAQLQPLNRLQSVRLSMAAMSLAAPALTLLDNPTAALSEQDAVGLIQDIYNWAKQSNTIVVVACNRWHDWHSSASQVWQTIAPDALPQLRGQA